MAKPEITYQIEPWADCAEEMVGLWRSYGVEAGLEVAPDNETYRLLSDDGALILATMRADAELVGIHRSIIGPDLHFGGKPYAVCDGWFVLPAWRRGQAALRLLALAEDEARKRGCASIVQASSPHRPIDRLLARLEWDRGETLFRKWL